MADADATSRSSDMDNASVLDSKDGAATGANSWTWSQSNINRRPATEPLELRVGAIGRGHAGKTALFKAMSLGPVGDYFPSGLHLDVGDPQEVAQTLRDAEETYQLLEACGLPPTLEAAPIRYFLYDGDDQRVVYLMREVVGQVLTHTLPDSSDEQKTRYKEYLATLLDTHVLWAVVPCPPPNPSPRDRRRYANDLRITSAYLQESLRQRPRDKLCSVAVVLSKIDTLFDSAEQARAKLSDEVVKEVLAPLVNAVNTSPKVTDAAIFPISAFGFGNAVLKEDGQPEPSDAPKDASRQLMEIYGEEPVWLLKEGATQQPFNLNALVAWTLFYGMLNQEVIGDNDREPEMARVCRMLQEDLESLEGWVSPIKGRGLDPTATPNHRAGQ